MTLKRAYINLFIAVILIIFNILLYALDVSRLNIGWTTTIYWISSVIALTSIGFSIFHFMRKKEDIMIEDVQTDEEDLEDTTTQTTSFFQKHKHEILDWVSFLSISMMLILMIFMFFVLPTNVEGKSMESTLVDGERVLMYHFNYTPERNDVVIVHITDRYLDTSGRQVNLSNEYSDQDQVYFVKRVVAIPGDTVTFEQIDQTDHYHILINGVVYQNQYYQIYEVDNAGRLKMISYLDQNNQLREDQYFAFGDNESFSYDSRNIGAIHEEDMIGKAIYKLSPLGGISHG
jgi:signal peptidase I